MRKREKNEMDKKNRFDESMKRLWQKNNEWKKPQVKEDYFGYKPFCGKRNNHYFSNDQWNWFKDEMKKDYKDIFNAFDKGSGKEMEEHWSKKNVVKNPPKMASVASSSLFTYLTFRKDPVGQLKKIIPDLASNGRFAFEASLQIRDVKKATAHPDGSYVVTNDRATYIESKCHELFDYHSLKWSKQYEKNGFFNSLEKEIVGSSIVLDRSTFGIDDREKLCLDVKQSICHLLAIANSGEKKKDLIFLYFIPESIENDYKMEYELLQKQFGSFCASKPIRDFCDNNKISLYLVFAKNAPFEEFKPEVKEKYLYNH